MNKPLIDAITKLLSILTLIGTIEIVVLAILALSFKFRSLRKVAIVKNLVSFVSKYALLYSFIVALVATTGSLFFSDIAGFAPCILCWYQRILMYPNVLLLGIALRKKSTEIIDYVLSLTGLGAVLGFYHYSQQFSHNPLLPCSTVGYSVSCAEKFFTHFGYITIPLMSSTAFSMIFLMLLIRKLNKK